MSELQASNNGKDGNNEANFILFAGYADPEVPFVPSLIHDHARELSDALSDKLRQNGIQVPTDQPRMFPADFNNSLKKVMASLPNQNMAIFFNPFELPSSAAGQCLELAKSHPDVLVYLVSGDKRIHDWTMPQTVTKIEYADTPSTADLICEEFLALNNIANTAGM